MITRTRTRLLTFATIVGLAVGVVVSMERWYSSRAAARTAWENVEVCRRLATQITALKGQPPRAALDPHSATELARRVEDAARSAGLTSDSILHIDPQPSRRVPDSPYLEKRTGLELRDVSLQQLATFLLALAADGTGPQVSALRMTAPRQQPMTNASAAEPWQAELTLTYLIFSPKTPQFQR